MFDFFGGGGGLLQIDIYINRSKYKYSISQNYLLKVRDNEEI